MFVRQRRVRWACTIFIIHYHRKEVKITKTTENILFGQKPNASSSIVSIKPHHLYTMDRIRDIAMLEFLIFTKKNHLFEKISLRVQNPGISTACRETTRSADATKKENSLAKGTETQMGALPTLEEISARWMAA